MSMGEFDERDFGGVIGVSGMDRPPAAMKQFTISVEAGEFTKKTVPGEAPSDLPKAIFMLGMLDVLSVITPDYFGERLDPFEMDAAIDQILDGEMFLVNRLAISATSYGSVIGQHRLLMRLVSLDAECPLLVEVDLPVVLHKQAKEWDDDNATITVLSRTDSEPFEHPLLLAVLQFIDMSPEEAMDYVMDSEMVGEPPSAMAMLEEFIEGEQSRTARRLLDGQAAWKASSEAKARTDREQVRRDLRRVERHRDSLLTQLDTANAIAARQRTRADGYEKELRARPALLPSSTIAAPAPAPAPATPVPTDVVSRADYDAVVAQMEALRVDLTQQGSELDELREQLHASRLRAQALALSGEAPPAVAALPATFDQLHEWVGQQLDDTRVLIHPKAIRTARKSVFRDPPLVYRVLQAVNDLYWPMKQKGDAEAGKKWDAFLERERLRCGPTGAALDDHRTRDTYQVGYQGKRYPLDLHIQGNSSRKEEDAFRVYFHFSRDLGKVLIGHFPTHLPNTHT